jgi:hypothetical protein
LILILWLQVPLLLSIGEEDTALMKAIESGDTDLVYLVLFHIWQKVICLENSTGTPIFLLQVSIYWITINNLENKKMLSLCRENLWIFSEWYKLEPWRAICLWFMHGRIGTLARYIFKLLVCVLMSIFTCLTSFVRFRCYKHEFLKDFFLSNGQLHVGFSWLLVLQV